MLIVPFKLNQDRRHHIPRLTPHDTDDASQISPLLDRVTGSVASVTGDGAYDQEPVYADIAKRHPKAAVIVPPRSSAVLSKTAETDPTPRDRHLQCIAKVGRLGWQKVAGYTRRAKAETATARWKQGIGDRLRARKDRQRTTELKVAVHVLNHMLTLGRPSYVRIGRSRNACGLLRHAPDPCTTAIIDVAPNPLMILAGGNVGLLAIYSEDLMQVLERGRLIAGDITPLIEARRQAMVALHALYQGCYATSDESVYRLHKSAEP